MHAGFARGPQTVIDTEQDRDRTVLNMQGQCSTKAATVSSVVISIAQVFNTHTVNQWGTTIDPLKQINTLKDGVC